MPDESLVNHIRLRLEQASVVTRWGPGRRAAEFGPYRLLSAVADYLETNRYQEFANLVRHPDVTKWLQKKESKVKFSLHRFRDIFATISRQCNHGMLTTKALMNHRFSDVTNLYLKPLTVEDLREPMKEIEETILGLAGNPGNPFQPDRGNVIEFQKTG